MRAMLLQGEYSAAMTFISCQGGQQCVNVPHQPPISRFRHRCRD
jgi:hypothetical protein